ncbi:hypothetical protein LINGRAHAP2_LOCUS22070, partial [Linum grandiflorum]
HSRSPQFRKHFPQNLSKLGFLPSSSSSESPAVGGRFFFPVRFSLRQAEERDGDRRRRKTESGGDLWFRMDELEEREAEEFLCDPFFGVVEEFDLDYEFDAPKFHDFTRREDDSEAVEADRWLDAASGYPPSPLAIKKYWRPLIGVDLNHSSSTTTNSSVEDDDHDTGSGSSNGKCELGSKPKEKSTVKPKSSSFMSPTASHLAKKQAAEQIRCERLLRRFPKDAKSEGKSSRSSSTSGVTTASKRQKLEAGYLRKAARLKHQAQFPHKESVKVSSKAGSGRFKATVPKEPNLATASRAERHRSRSENSGQLITSLAETRPLNKKIQKIPSLPIPRKATRQLPELQGARLHRSKSSSEKENRNLTSLNAGLPVKDRRELREKSKSFNIKGQKGSTERRVMDEPPVDAFRQLSLASKLHATAHLQAKITKENTRKDSKRDKEVHH